MEFYIKVIIPSSLKNWKKQVVQDLRDGLHMQIGGGYPYCPYLTELEKVRIVLSRKSKKRNKKRCLS